MTPNFYARFVRAVSHLPYFKGKSRLVNLLVNRVQLPQQAIGTDFPHGFTMNLNPDSPWEKSYYTHDKELDTTHFLKSQLKPGDVFWDIGANIGFYSLLASRIIGKEGQVYSFEPTPDTFQRLQHHVQLNKITNIQHMPYVLGPSAGTAQIVKPNLQNHGMNFFNLTESGDGFQVNSIDHFVEKENLRAPNIMKIDVEGAELNVLKGAQKTLSKYAPAMVIEISEATLKRFGHTPRELLDLIFSCHPYEMYFNFRGKQIRVTTQELPHTRWLGADHGYNYMFLPKR